MMNHSPKESRVPVALIMVDGEILRGNMRMPISGRLVDAMNSSDLYLILELADGSTALLAKHSVRRLNPIDMPRNDQLLRRSTDSSVFDPHAILGVPRNASAEEIKAAYHNLVRTYHPDRFASAGLPREMLDYSHAMLTRINAAYEQLEDIKSHDRAA
jgi:DnaJ-domain-containing protein 1